MSKKKKKSIIEGERQTLVKMITSENKIIQNMMLKTSYKTLMKNEYCIISSSPTLSENHIIFKASKNREQKLQVKHKTKSKSNINWLKLANWKQVLLKNLT